MRCHRVWTLLVLAIATSPAPALAQTAPVQPSGTVKDAASTDEKALLAEAAKLYHEGKWAEAEGMFRRAFEVNPAYATAGNLALCQQQLGKLREAAEHLSYALRHWPAGEKAASRDLAVKTLAELTAALGTVTVKVDAPGARVVVNGREVGRSPLLDPVFVEPGKATLSAFKEGFSTVKVEVEVSAGQELPVTLTLEPPPPPPPTASVTATTSATPMPAPGPRKELLIGGASIAGVALITGVATAIGAGIASNDATKQRDALLTQPGACVAGPQPAACTALEAKRNEQSALTNAAFLSFVGAGLAGGATLAYALIVRAKAPQPVVGFSPAVSASGGGLVVVGRF